MKAKQKPPKSRHFRIQQLADGVYAAIHIGGGAAVGNAGICSHYHNDHIWGNQVFSPETDIISTMETRRLIVATQGHDDFDAFKASAETNLETTQAAFQAEQDAAERRQLAVWIDYHRAFVEAKPILQVRPPNLTFAEHLAFHGAARSAELIAFSRGHSPSDAVLVLPQEGVAFMSDLLFIGYHPWLGAGDPDQLLHILRDVSGLNMHFLYQRRSEE
jgi:glyoxylase-like metal-dependent hydrolase (beta-lactamase superfamily II)